MEQLEQLELSSNLAHEGVTVSETGFLYLCSGFMQAIEYSADKMAKAIGYVVLELERTGCAITAEATNKRLSIVLDKDSKVASESVTPSKQLQFNKSLCG